MEKTNLCLAVRALKISLSFIACKKANVKTQLLVDL